VLFRSQYLLSRGQFAADLLYYYGEGAARDYQPSRLKPVPPQGFDWDACNAEILLKATVDNGRIFLPSGMFYRVLVLPDYSAMSPQVAEKIQDLVRAGATVVGPKPTSSPSLSDYPNCDQQVKQIGQQVWGDSLPHKYGRGKVIPATSLEKELGAKDFDSQGTPLHWIHRHTDKADIYFVANPRDHYIKSLCTFRISGKLPELWHPDTGQIEPAAVYWDKDGKTALPLSFDPVGSVFVVFRKPALPKSDSIASISHDGQSIYQTQPAPSGQLKILSATYGLLNGKPEQQVQATDHIASAVADGMLSTIVSNELCGQDPAKNHHKQLRVKYSFQGQERTVTVAEGATMELPDVGDELTPVEALSSGNGAVKFRVWQGGDYEVRTTQGRRFKLSATQPQVMSVEGSWQIHFPPKSGAPDSATFEKLESWSKSQTEGIKYFSGTATYSKQLDIPKEMVSPEQEIYLDLGAVKNLAEVSLNGKSLGILWKPPFRVSLTGVAHVGSNQLVIKVTNLWPNRLIGDQKIPEAKRVTWAAYSPYTKDSPLLESGLLGPVQLMAIHPNVVQLAARKP